MKKCGKKNEERKNKKIKQNKTKQV